MIINIKGVTKVPIALKSYFLSKNIKQSAIPQAKLVANSYWFVRGTLPAPMVLAISAKV